MAKRLNSLSDLGLVYSTNKEYTPQPDDENEVHDPDQRLHHT
mgnify:CR=1 FL=1